MTDVLLPVSLPMGEVFGERPTWDERTGSRRHKCWFCSSKAERRFLYPPMPPKCTLCARCGVLIYTGEDDLENEAMIVCQKCDAELEDKTP